MLMVSNKSVSGVYSYKRNFQFQLFNYVQTLLISSPRYRYQNSNCSHSESMEKKSYLYKSKVNCQNQRIEYQCQNYPLKKSSFKAKMKNVHFSTKRVINCPRWKNVPKFWSIPWHKKDLPGAEVGPFRVEPFPGFASRPIRVSRDASTRHLGVTGLSLSFLFNERTVTDENNFEENLPFFGVLFIRALRRARSRKDLTEGGSRVSRASTEIVASESFNSNLIYS